MLTLTTSLVLFLSTFTSNQSPVVLPQVVENTAIVQASTTELLAEEAIPVAKAIDPTLTDEENIRNYFADTPILIKVSWCESKLKQFKKNGALVRGELTPEDVGAMQINEYFHLKDSKKLGFDIHTLEGNLAYAKYLYEKKGTQPWSASKYCWTGEIPE